MDTSRNFLRVLVEPKAPRAVEIDIVAVHGLNPFKNTSNAISTWTADNGKMWLQDEGFLPTQIPNARVMLFGYNSNVAFTSSNAGLVQHASNLLFLLDLRRTDCPNRPIIFLCHSLGGILVKRALVQARLVDSYAMTYKATYGIVFFGTPHGGGNNAEVGDLAARIARKVAGRRDNNFMEALKKTSYYGEQNRDDFLYRAKDFSYISFFEANPKKALKLFSVQVVDRKNAVLGLDDEREPKFAMDADHSGMCKFSDPEGDDYFPVWTNILKMSKQAVKESKPLKNTSLEENGRGLIPSRVGIAGREKSYYILPPLSVSCYVKRPALMKQLEEYSAPTSDSPRPMVILLGMGGQGKSQLTMEYCRTARESRKCQAIFWIDATSDNSLVRSFEDITAKICDSPPTFDSISARITFIKEIIEGWSFPWLLVFDNYDLPDEVMRISNCFPQSGSGNIIVTSRHASSARLGKVIEVTGMEEEEAIDLLLSRSQLPHTEENISEAKPIVGKLGCLPLALDQAGSYMSAQSLSMSLFAKEYEERKVHILKYTPSLTEYKKKLNDSDAETALNVFTTLELSLGSIGGDAETRQAIEDFLTLSAFFNSAKIGEDLARIATIEYKPNWMQLFTSEGVWDRYKFQDIMADLNHISLLHSLYPGETVYFSLHPLVVDWLILRQERSSCRAYTILGGSVLNHVLGMDDFWAMQLDTRQYLLAHIDAYLRNQANFLESLDFMDKAVLDALFRCGNCLSQNYRYNEAEKIYRRVLENRKKIYGTNHKSILYSLHNLAITLDEQRKFDEAEEMYQRALHGCEKVLGLDHPDTLNTVNNLGILYKKQGKLDEAEEMHQRALRRCEKVLGLDHPDTLNTVSNLGGLYWKQGKLKEAEEMHQKALRGRENVLGLDHPDTLRTINNLGTLYEKQDKLKEAEEMYQRALRGCKKVLGLDHPDTLRTINNLGTLYEKQDKLKEAEEMYQRALRGREKVLGLDNIKTLNTCEGLGLVFGHQGRQEESKEILQRAVQGYEKLLGADHSETKRASRNLKWAENLGRRRSRVPWRRKH